MRTLRTLARTAGGPGGTTRPWTEARLLQAGMEETATGARQRAGEATAMLQLAPEVRTEARAVQPRATAARPPTQATAALTGPFRASRIRTAKTRSSAT